jgi:hypothetical protein
MKTLATTIGIVGCLYIGVVGLFFAEKNRAYALRWREKTKSPLKWLHSTKLLNASWYIWNARVIGLLAIAMLVLQMVLLILLMLGQISN